MESNSEIALSQIIGSIKPRSLDSNNNVSTSLADPKEIYKNCINSLSDLLAEPSAILTGMDTLARRICEVRPYFSSGGKTAVREYICLTNSKLFFHTSRFWCGFIRQLFRFENKNINILPLKQPASGSLIPISISRLTILYFPLTHYSFK